MKVRTRNRWVRSVRITLSQKEADTLGGFLGQVQSEDLTEEEYAFVSKLYRLLEMSSSKPTKGTK